MACRKFATLVSLWVSLVAVSEFAAHISPHPHTFPLADMVEAAASCKDGIRLPSVESHGNFKWLMDLSGCGLSNTYDAYAYGTHSRGNANK